MFCTKGTPRLCSGRPPQDSVIPLTDIRVDSAWRGLYTVEYSNDPLMLMAMSLGLFMHYQDSSWLASAKGEEALHQVQSLLLGPAYLPAHGVARTASLCMNRVLSYPGWAGDWSHRWNILEVAS